MIPYLGKNGNPVCRFLPEYVASDTVLCCRNAPCSPGKDGAAGFPLRRLASGASQDSQSEAPRGRESSARCFSGPSFVRTRRSVFPVSTRFASGFRSKNKKRSGEKDGAFFVFLFKKPRRSMSLPGFPAGRDPSGLYACGLCLTRRAAAARARFACASLYS